MRALKLFLIVFGAISSLIVTVYGGLMYWGMDAMQHGCSGQHIHEYYLDKWFGGGQ